MTRATLKSRLDRLAAKHGSAERLDLAVHVYQLVTPADPRWMTWEEAADRQASDALMIREVSFFVSNLAEFEQLREDYRQCSTTQQTFTPQH